MVIKIGGEDYYSAKEAAEFLGVSSQTFTGFIEKYKLQWMERPGMGRTKLFKKTDIEPLLQFRPGKETRLN